MEATVIETASGGVPGVPRTPGTFALKVAESGRMALARVEGPLNTEHCPGFLQRVQPLCHGLRRIVLDLRRTEYVDSCGVRALLKLQEELAAANGELRLVLLPGSTIERTLSLLRLTGQFKTYCNASEAWIRRPDAA